VLSRKHNVEIAGFHNDRYYPAMPRQPKPTRLKSRDAGSFKGLLVRMNLDGWRELRILAAERDTTLNALAIEAFNDLLKKRGKQPVVQNPLASED
jgi:hypothetical protein